MRSHANPFNCVLNWIIFTENYICSLYGTPMNNIKLFHWDFSKSTANTPAFLVVRYIIFFFFLLLMVPQKGPEGWKDKYNLNRMSTYDIIAQWIGQGREHDLPSVASYKAEWGRWATEFWYHTSSWQKGIKQFTSGRDTIKQMGEINSRHTVNKVTCSFRWKRQRKVSTKDNLLLIMWSSSPELSQSLLTNAFLFSSRNWLGMRPALPPSFTWLA